MKKLIWMIVIAVVATGLYFGLRGPQPASNEQPIKIGAILPLSGDFSAVGIEMQRGMEIALQERSNKDIKVLYEDEQTFNDVLALNALNKLIAADKVSLVFNSVVANIKALAPRLKETKTPGVVLWDSNELIGNLNEYVFSIGFSTEQAGARMADFAYSTLGLKNAAVVSAIDEWSEIISTAFSNRFTSLGGTIALYEKINLETRDVRTSITKIKKVNAQAIYFPLYLQSLSSLVKQARELDYRGHLLSADAFTNNDVQTLGRAAEGIYITQLWFTDPSFLKKYKDKYGEARDPYSLAFAGLGYDAVNLTAELINKIREKDIVVTPQTLRDTLASFQFDGITGKVTFLPSKRTADKIESILLVKNGEFIKLEK